MQKYTLFLTLFFGPITIQSMDKITHTLELQSLFKQQSEKEQFDLDKIKLAIKKGGDLNYRGIETEHKTIFKVFCENEKITVNMLQLFLEEGANLFAKPQYGTPLEALTKNKAFTLEMLTLLIKDKYVAINNEDESERETIAHHICGSKTVSLEKYNI